MEKIKEYIEKEFKKFNNITLDKDSLLELKEEILSNCYERYDECLEQGLSSDDAEKLVISKIGDLSELIQETAYDTKSIVPVNNNEIRKLKVEVVRRNVEVRVSDDNEIHVDVKENEDTLMLKQKGNTFKIEDKETVFHKWFSFGSNYNKGDIVVYVPLEMEKIDIETVSGDINLYLDNVEKVDCESISGNITCTGGLKDNSSFESVSGNIVVESYGDFDKARLETVSGNIEFTSLQTDGLDYDVESMFGKTTIDAHRVIGKNRLKIESLSGNIIVR